MQLVIGELQYLSNGEFNTTVLFDQMIMAAGLALTIVLYGTAANTQNARQEMGLITERSA